MKPAGTTDALALYCKDFAFEEDYLTKYLICGVCKMVMRNPVRLHHCGHTFCQKCVLTPYCFDCSLPYKCKQPDLIAANLVADSIVRCLAKDCPFRGTFQAYTSTHKNTCKMNDFNGLEGWMQKCKQSLEDVPRKGKPVPVVDCQVVEVAETEKEPSVFIQHQTYRRSELQSLVIQQERRKEIDAPSFYQVNPQNQARVEQQARELKEKGPRRCQYGKNCKLMLEEGGCPYIHPEKNPRRQYQLDKWATLPVYRPPNKVDQPEDELWKKGSSTDDIQYFINQYFPVHKLPDRKRETEVQIVAAPRNKSKTSVIEI